MDLARQSRNRRSADSFVRVLICDEAGLADKAVRAPRKFAQENKTFIDSSFHIRPPGWKPGDTAAKDGCRYGGSGRIAPAKRLSNFAAFVLIAPLNMNQP